MHDSSIVKTVPIVYYKDNGRAARLHMTHALSQTVTTPLGVA